ncbi:putative serine/threonine-protein kinase dyrk1 [Gracilariopsis chorda]|uniref:Putative serine/threonine-protein kinase dyrk1 n=1 Tax=Gracilariopsis chorda TaxID=448386 RepID=A0A2V3IPM4_9FLOR|nr:putative serine/threonine-protein kinase dyrk1 [Gracilariopsis chorda]|eukprot:PXF44007.1 putative serine/threonine-protein kinase dyrk1 [Gracilariopsis chorda]
MLHNGPYLTPVVQLTVKLMDTYQHINVAFFQTSNQPPPPLPPPTTTATTTATAIATATATATTTTSTTTTTTTTTTTANTTTTTAAATNAKHPHRTAVNQSSSRKLRSNSNSNVPSAKHRMPCSPMSVQYCDKNFDYIVRTGELFYNRYTLEKVIGRGSFGQVVRAYDTADNTHVAIKIIKNHNLYVEQALSEARMTSYLNCIDPMDSHAIMRLRDKFIFRGHHCLVLELLSFSLYDLLRSTDFYGVSLNLVRKFCKQILSCLSFLARPDVNIAHCDLKPENVLLRHPQRSAIKVVDFGASCRISQSMFTYVQSRFYRAPEVILGLPYSTQVDVWSLGCMLIELHTGYPLFAGKDEADQMAIIVQRLGLPPPHMLETGSKSALFFERDADTAQWRLRPNPSSAHATDAPRSETIDAFVDYHTGGTNGRRKRVSGGHSEVDYDMFLSLVMNMLQYDPAQRISAEDALRDPFVRGTLARGRDSPPPMPNVSSVDGVVGRVVETGRKAPVQGLRPGVALEELERHTERSLGNMSDVVADVRVSGTLPKSKSEPHFPKVAPPAHRDFVFRQSDWAEEVGIEPPPWRAGGGVSRFIQTCYSRVCTRGEMRIATGKRLPPAGGGAPIEGGVRCAKSVESGFEEWERRRLEEAAVRVGEGGDGERGIGGRRRVGGGGGGGKGGGEYRSSRRHTPLAARGHGHVMALFA